MSEERCPECGSWGEECMSETPVKDCGCARCLSAALEQERALRVMAEKFHDVAVKERDYERTALNNVNFWLDEFAAGDNPTAEDIAAASKLQGDVLRKKLAEARAELVWAKDSEEAWIKTYESTRTALVDARKHLSNLLARIHRDGGHYEDEHGTDKAVADADEIVARLYSERTE